MGDVLMETKRAQPLRLRTRGQLRELKGNAKAPDRAATVRTLRQVLLVIIGAEAFSFTEITESSRRGLSTRRLSVDVDIIDPAVDRDAVRLKQCLSDDDLTVDHDRLRGPDSSFRFPACLKAVR